MTPIDLNVLLFVSGGLLLLAGGLAAFRPDPREVGVGAALVLLALGLVSLALYPMSPLPGGFQLDSLSAPRLPLAGLSLGAIFLVMPRRHGTPRVARALVALAVLHILLASAPADLIGAVWAASCVATALALPSGPARSLAWPYLILAAGSGLAGTMLGGEAGMALLVLAVAVRLGVFPFHSWVVASYHMAPTTIAVAIAAPMAAIVLVARTPMGFDGRLGLAVTVALALGAILTAGMAIVQTELARAVGFITVSVQTIVFLGVLDADHIGHLGGLIMWSITGLALVGLGLVTAALRSRVGPVRIDDYAGLLDQAPVLGALFLLFGMAAVGAPGTADFASEDLVLHGAIAHHTGLLLLFICAISLQGYATLHLFFRVFFGPPRSLVVADALPRERLALAVMGGLIVGAGLAPQLLINGWLLTEHAASTIMP